MVLVKYLQAFLTMHYERLICAFVYPNSMRLPFQHHSNVPLVHLPQSGSATDHMGQLSLPPNLDPNLSAGSEIYLVSYTGGIDRAFSCKRSRSLHNGQACAFFFHFRSSFLLLTPRTEELPRNKEEASCQLIPTSQYSYHATTQPSSTIHIIITATTLNYYCLDTFCCPWYYWGNGNSFASSYHRCWMARLFRGLDLLHAH
ncbi:hypothetical protein P692DRAFT_20259408 [Suillus brevipes Sb2]|nr:hypothetical protein P692DRAFT_20259408 [Suillus brevipes Sb2]